MKILVDKMPENPSECPHSRPGSWGTDGQEYMCEHESRYFRCQIGEDDNFNCPHYREFKAQSIDTDYATFMKRVPVELKDE